MINISVKSNIDEFTKDLSSVTAKQVPFAVMKAINDTAFHVMEAERESTKRHIDNPTPFTQKSVRVRKARTKRSPTAWVFLTPVANEYLEPLVDGGFARPAKTALLTPISSRRGVRNKYGNIPRTFSQRTRSNTARYFHGVPRGRKGSQYEGIWERYGRGGRRIRQLVHFDKKGWPIQKQWPFYEIAQDQAHTRFPWFFWLHFDRALRTARV